MATLAGDSRRRRVPHERVARVPRRAAAPKSDVVVLLDDFGLTVLVDLTVAIEVGMVLAAFLFMRRMAEVDERERRSRREMLRRRGGGSERAERA